MSDCLGMGGSTNVSHASAMPKLDRRLDQARLGEMVRQDLRLRIDGIQEFSFKDLTDTRVQFLSLTAQQGTVGGILDERVLEHESCLRRRATLDKEARVNEPTESPP